MPDSDEPDYQAEETPEAPPATDEAPDDDGRGFPIGIIIGAIALLILGIILIVILKKRKSP
jgi:hypothetical protein